MTANMAIMITITKTNAMVLGGGAGGRGGESGYGGGWAEAAAGAMKILNRHIITVIIITARAASAAILTWKLDLREIARYTIADKIITLKVTGAIIN